METVGGDFLGDVVAFDADVVGAVFFVEIDDVQVTAGFEGARNVGEHFVGIVEVVVDVEDQDVVDGGGGEGGTGFGAQDQGHVREIIGGDFGAGAVEEVGGDVFAEDAAIGADGFAQEREHVAGAGADVGYRRAGREVHGGDDFFGFLILVAVGVVE